LHGLVSNKFYLTELLSSTSILCLQEHWLYSFEKQILQDLDKRFLSVIKSVDDMVPISPIQRPRGFGGVAILYSSELEHCTTPIPDGGSNIAGVVISTTDIPVVILSIYMPSRGKGKPQETYVPVLDELAEIIAKYEHTHNIICCGDFNASFTRRYTDAQDTLFIAFCKNNNLVTPEGLPDKDTFRSGNGSSQIDYILAKCDKTIITDCIIPDVTPTNVSDHVPVLATMHLSIKTKSRSKASDTPLYPKPR
jgi:endonuclease/exonuclease/phosphatase family metal-dependent hydrolase